MPDVTIKLAILSLLGASIAACSSAPDQSNAASQDMAIDDNVAAQPGGDNIAIETLPADESSDASNAQLSSGAADVINTGNEE